MTIQKLIKRSPNPKLIEQAYEFARIAYKDKFRASGENYIHHAVRVALALEKMGVDSVTIAFALLHDVADDMPEVEKKANIEAIEKKFGKDIGSLTEKISGLGKARYSLSVLIKEKKIASKEKIENSRKMFLALAGDIRVVLVELVSRLDGLNFLKYLPEDRQKLYSLETLRIFVPIANRLGLSKIRRNLEDGAFSYLLPEKFEWVKKNVKEEYEEREKYLKKFIPRLKKIFKRERVKIIEVNYRAKSYWSIYKKLFTHNMDFGKIHDLLAMRIISADVASCYKILGVIHKYFQPISEEINDYIAKPKPNGYRSLHTTIYSAENKITEIQIRTEQMHKEAEYGICAHWSYKEKIDLKKEGQNFEWVEQTQNLWKEFKIDSFRNQVFTFTPKGDVIVLPKGSTPVDFAYAVHSEVGNKCESAKINNKITPLDHLLENGDIVEISTNKNKKPSKDWLRFVKTSFARSHIKKLTEETPSVFKLPIPGFIRKKFSEITEFAKKKSSQTELIKKEGPRQIYLAGQKGMLVNIAKCCNPQPGDKVKAYLAKHRPAVLHKILCSNLKKLEEKFPERIIDASWK